MRRGGIRSLLSVMLVCRPLIAQGRGGELSPASIAQRATPATVTIVTFGALGDTLGQGSGFIVRATGEILTNYHVMAGASRAVVQLSTGERFERVEAVDSDSLADLAIIKIPGYALPVVTMSSTTPPVGSKVVVIGSPLGLSQTVSDGLVSGLRLRDGKQVLQISAPISHGSSGGPVFSESGNVIGIATASIESGQQLNFAVPARYALGLLAEKRSPRPLAEMFATSRAVAGAATQIASTQAQSSARATFPLRAEFLHRTNPPGATHPTLPFAGKFFINDSTAVTPVHGGPWGLVLLGDAYLMDDGFGFRYERELLGDSLSDATFHWFLTDLNATADGRLSLAAINALMSASPGYQTDNGAFFASESNLGDSITYSSRVHMVRDPSNLSVNEGLYRVQLLTTYEAGSFHPPEILQWDGDMLIVRIANGDSVFVRMIVRNAKGGSTGLNGMSWQPRTATHFNVVGFDGTTSMTFTLENGRVSGTWLDQRPGALYRGTLEGTRK